MDDKLLSMIIARIDKIDEKVDRLYEKMDRLLEFKWRVIGFAIAVAMVWSGVQEIAAAYFKSKI